jgi:hypothetical protein
MAHKRIHLIVAALLAGSMLLISGCASTTLIQSEPTGAKVYIEDEPVGYTPFPYTDTKIVGSYTYVRLEKEGYQPFITVLSRDEEVDIAPIIGGFCGCWPLWLWFMKYKPIHFYELVPEPGGGTL